MAQYKEQHVIESNIWNGSVEERFGTSPNHVPGRPSRVADVTGSTLGKWGILDPHESISAATEWSEREHLHAMVNKLTLENIEIKNSCTTSDKLNFQLEDKVKDLEVELGETKKQVNKSLITEKELSGSEIVRSDWVSGCASVTSVNSVVTQGSTQSVSQMKGPGIIIQLSTNPWQEDQESQALRELVNIVIESMTPPILNDPKSKDVVGLGFAVDTMQAKDSFEYQTSFEDQYLLPVELSDIERLTAVMNTRKVVAKCDFDREVMSMDGDIEGDPARFFLNIHRSPNGNISDGDIENIITTLKFERKKNEGLLNAVKELEKQQYELTHAKRAALIHLERERTQNKRLTTVISTLKQHKRLPIAPPISRSGKGTNNLWSSRWFLLCFGALMQIIFTHFFSFMI